MTKATGSMLYFKCQDICFDCPKEFDADTREKLIEKIKEHLQKVHLNGCPPSESMILRIEKAIKRGNH
jgi:predicted small metal-binding protein